MKEGTIVRRTLTHGVIGDDMCARHQQHLLTLRVG